MNSRQSAGSAGVDLRGAFQIAFEGTRQVLLAREIRAVADPHRQRRGAQRLPDMDAFEIVRNGLLAHGLGGVA